MCVSIIIPIHNSEKYLKECIESALNQSFYEIELLCIDGGSTDDSFKIIDEMRKKDNRIKYIFDTNTSYGHKINVGVRSAKGKYIAILESDDMMGLTMIESLYNTAEESGADVVDADFYELFSYQGRKYRNMVKKYVAPETYNCLITCKDGNPQEEFKAIWTALYRKDFLVDCNIWLNESEGASYQDSSFVFLVNFLADTFYHLDIPLYQYRIDNGESSVKDDRKIFEIIKEYEFLKNNLIQRQIKDKEAWKSYYKSKYDSFYWNYRRLSQNSRAIFLEKYLQELKQDSKDGLINREMFSGGMYNYTFRIIDDSESFVNEVAERDKKPSLIKLLEDLARMADRRLVVFGAGIWGTKVISILVQSSYNLCAVCDNSKVLQGAVKCGYNIISVKEAVSLFPDAVYLIVNRKYGKDMKKQLLKENIQEENVMIFG